MIDRGVDPEVAVALTGEVAAALRADPASSFAAATRVGFAAHQGISLDEAARAERGFTLSPPEVAAVLGEHFDEIAGRQGNDDQVTIEDLHDAIDDESLAPEARDVAYRLAVDAVLFTNLDVALQTDLSEELLGNGFAWHEADGIIGRHDVAVFPGKDHQARILLAWHPLVETAGQGYDLTEVDFHASTDDVAAFVEDEDIPAHVRLAVFDVYAQRHDLELTERERLEQELAFDGTTYGGGTYLDVSRGPSSARVPPVAPVRAGHTPAIVHTDPVTGRQTTVDPAELVHLSPAEAKAYVAHFVATGTPPPEGTDRIAPHAYLDPFGQRRM